ncbi:helix-turn-helix domain-containing protein [Williamsia sterculiae]|uniref:Helix-turn-helix domain-containing protein n=1 Tax=Williamsia sterculiae TaxID=1344003 RepID=A0A1N7HEQ2_9NOCA|nr:helix-turn-helix transcriptional regulator [Williamsia sterculiae]SIS23312.1 Helix-turn-helix domain-containing protein [Williamsia sterculiae]
MPDHLYFADVVHRRRRELGLSQADVVHAGGPSGPTLVRIESGTFPALRPPTFKKLDQALRWTPGSAYNVYLGGDPEEAGRDRPPSARGQFTLPLARLIDLIEIAGDMAALATKYEQDPALHAALDKLRDVLSPMVGKVISAMLNAELPQQLPPPDRVAAAVDAFLQAPAEDETPARTAENTRRRIAAERLRYGQEIANEQPGNP